MCHPCSPPFLMLLALGAPLPLLLLSLLCLLSLHLLSKCLPNPRSHLTLPLILGPMLTRFFAPLPRSALLRIVHEVFAA